MIDLEKPSSVYIYTNSKAEYEKTGTLGLLVFKWGDKLQISRSFGYTKDKEIGLHVPMYKCFNGQSVNSIPMLQGSIENSLLKIGIKSIESIDQSIKGWGKRYTVDVETFKAKVI